MNDQLSHKILERIEADNIAPLPRWRFLMLRGIFGLLAILSVVVGGFAVGAMLFLFIDYHRHGLLPVPHDLTEFLLMIPYIWIVIFVMFIISAEESIKHTGKGYRYRLRSIVAVCLFLSVILGSILNYVGVGKLTHESMNTIPAYNYVTFDARDAWNRPVVGRLAGTVLSIQDSDHFSIADWSGRVWTVRLATSTNGQFVPEVHSTVRMSGFLESSSSAFVANSVIEWEK